MRGSMPAGSGLNSAVVTGKRANRPEPCVTIAGAVESILMTDIAGASRVTLSVVIPGYNEQANIRTAVETCCRALEELKVPFEIVVVNDGSSDDTGAIADALAAADPRIRVVHNIVNVNVGIALLVGYRTARGELVTHNAMDLPFDPKDLASILPMFEDPDMGLVVVSRVDRSAHSPWRKVTSFVHHWMVRALFWSALPDMNFILVWRRSAIAPLGVRARSPAFVTPELIIRARDAGLKIGHFRTVFHTRKIGTGQFGKPRDILWTLADMLSFWIERRVQRRKQATGRS
jgi:glycosyltransferase involved in cell wall biosynthesis